MRVDGSSNPRHCQPPAQPAMYGQFRAIAKPLARPVRTSDGQRVADQGRQFHGYSHFAPDSFVSIAAPANPSTGEPSPWPPASE